MLARAAGPPIAPRKAELLEPLPLRAPSDRHGSALRGRFAGSDERQSRTSRPRHPEPAATPDSGHSHHRLRSRRTARHCGALVVRAQEPERVWSSRLGGLREHPLLHSAPDPGPTPAVGTTRHRSSLPSGPEPEPRTPPPGNCPFSLDGPSTVGPLPQTSYPSWGSRSHRAVDRSPDLHPTKSRRPGPLDPSRHARPMESGTGSGATPGNRCPERSRPYVGRCAVLLEAVRSGSGGPEG